MPDLTRGTPLRKRRGQASRLPPVAEKGPPVPRPLGERGRLVEKERSHFALIMASVARPPARRHTRIDSKVTRRLRPSLASPLSLPAPTAHSFYFGLSKQLKFSSEPLNYGYLKADSAGCVVSNTRGSFSKSSVTWDVDCALGETCLWRSCDVWWERAEWAERKG